MALFSKKTERVYLAHKEKIPYRAVKSSKFTPKAMFLGEVARPRWNQYCQCTFDVKIGIFPLLIGWQHKETQKIDQRGQKKLNQPSKLLKWCIGLCL